MPFSHLPRLNQYLENNLFEDAKKLFSPSVCDLKNIPISPRNQDENVKVTKSLFTLKVVSLMIRACFVGNFNQVSLGSTHQLDGYRFCYC